MEATQRKYMYQLILDQLTTVSIPRYSEFQIFGDRIVLPIIPIQIIEQMCSDVSNIFQNEQTLIELRSPLLVVGDIHGHLLDLIRIIQTHGLPPKCHYLFLGDLVDRGEFSIETVSIVLMMKILWPEYVTVIRGNHEFAFLVNQCGFSKQLSQVYPCQSPLPSFLEAFSYMPLAAIIDQSVLCVHAGIGPNLMSITQIQDIKRPIMDFGDPIIDSILWSDPSKTTDLYAPSNRGLGYLFGKVALNDFLTFNKLKLLIRAHECAMHGFEYAFCDKLLTVFSASNYCGTVKNEAAVIDFRGVMIYETLTYEPITYLKRETVTFIIFMANEYSKPKEQTRKRAVIANSRSFRIKAQDIEKLPMLLPKSGGAVQDKKKRIFSSASFGGRMLSSMTQIE